MFNDYSLNSEVYTMPRNKLSPLEKQIRYKISVNLKKYSRGITQAQLSVKTGIPVSTLSGYFSMRSTPNAGAVQKIADALGVNKSDIDPRFSENYDIDDTDLQNVINIYRQLDSEGKRNVINFAISQLNNKTQNLK